MGDFAGIIEALSKGWTPGGVGIWVIVGSILGMWWKGLPAVLDSMSKSSAQGAAKIEREIARLEAQITASDSRHEECMEGQAKLRRQIAAQDETISQLVITIRQMQLRGVEGVGEIPATMASLLARIG